MIGNQRLRQRLAPLLFLVALATGCASSGNELLEDPVTVRAAFGADLSGRPFMFHILEAEAEDGTLDHILQIDGDGIVVSFHSSTPPFAPVLSRGVVAFGGHDFATTGTPNDYLVDGQPVTLPAPGIYIVSDGEMYGQYPWH